MLTGSFYNDNDSTHPSILVRMVNMKDKISHEAEETVITNLLHFAFDDTKDEHQEDMNIIDCIHIRIGTLLAENKEPVALCADTGAFKSVISKKKMRRILDMLGRRCMPPIRNRRVFRFCDVSARS